MGNKAFPDVDRKFFAYFDVNNHFLNLKDLYEHPVYSVIQIKKFLILFVSSII